MGLLSQNFYTSETVFVTESDILATEIHNHSLILWIAEWLKTKDKMIHCI